MRGPSENNKYYCVLSNNCMYILDHV
jgi:hypothetical protein